MLNPMIYSLRDKDEKKKKGLLNVITRKQVPLFVSGSLSGLNRLCLEI